MTTAVRWEFYGYLYHYNGYYTGVLQLPQPPQRLLHGSFTATSIITIFGRQMGALRLTLLLLRPVDRSLTANPPFLRLIGSFTATSNYGQQMGALRLPLPSPRPVDRSFATNSTITTRGTLELYGYLYHPYGG
jgi:hypothetical protein